MDVRLAVLDAVDLARAEDLQEEILCLPPVERGRDPVGEKDVRAIAPIADWRVQRAAWRALTARSDRALR